MKNNPSNQKKFSIIIPVYHESNTIHKSLKKIDHILKNENTEIIIVDGSKKKDTIQTIHHPKIQTLSSPTGRGPQLNAGAAIAKGNILIFLHADTTLSNNALERIEHTLTDSSIFAGTFSLAIHSPKIRYHLLAWFINLRAQLLRLPFGDQTYFITKTNFISVGGFPNIPLMEDLEFMRILRRQGKQIKILKDTSITCSRRWDSEGILRCTLRNWFIRLQYYLGRSPTSLKHFYDRKDDGTD
ncbi:MAG: TIGR04283 family arsenosugar biosynthesis glycosyltransferase [Candidatus Thermoplasmatota archaeon]|nr:TIGR04283 family arsenosugar biosynthesis glycosyltransferase [Candidatus Thermoplasmatota archaeon]MBU1941900.1 TIGR04283 family arsenosugar biosynthesis glycosyltransferase [Candidatus Thermoplasmatota archaeon]